jgi:predicted transcriptional regulator
MQTKQVKDLMLSLEEYAVVPRTATLRKALATLTEAQQKLPPGKPLHRAVLVTDGTGRIVGKLGQIGFLKALEPKYEAIGDLEELSQAQLSDDFISSIMDTYRFWQDSLDDLCQRANQIQVGQVMTPIDASIEENKSLSEAIHQFVMRQDLSVLVTRQGKAVGILRLSDLFLEVARFVTSTECPEE